jgi:S-DNA-T family DNA segregation ATPase FtsK/SpoIIIE
MFENRDLKSDLTALALFAAALFLAAALLTYDPADPIPAAPVLSWLRQPDVLIYPQNAKIHNLCGAWGAILSDFLLTFFGVGVYYMAGSLAVLTLLFIRGQKIESGYLRLAGWTGTLVAICCLAALLAPSWGAGPIVGPGGYLGVFARQQLESHFARPGAIILAVTGLVAGLMVCTDYFLLRALAAATAAVVIGGKNAGKVAALPAQPLKSAMTALARRGGGNATEEIGPNIVQKTPSMGNAVPTALFDRDGQGKSKGKRRDDLMVPSLAQPMLGAPSDEELIDQPEEVEEELETKVEVAAAPAPPPPVVEQEVKIRKPKQPSEREQMIASLKGADAPSEAAKDYELPSLELLTPGTEFSFDDQAVEVRRKAKILEKTFLDFGYRIRVVEIEPGPVIAQYEIELEKGLRLSKITGLADDLAIALRVPSVRIVAPIPGKNTVGVEVPNETRQMVRLRDVMEEGLANSKKMLVPMFLGKDVAGRSLVVDLAKLPHLLIAGRTGTGKSVCLNALICSILMSRRPDEVRMLMIDPKMVELSGYARLPHLMHPVVTDMRKAEAILAWAVEKMEERYALLARAGVRQLTSYNQLGEEELYNRLGITTDEEKQGIPVNLPFIVIVADEMADLMMTSGKEVEQHIIRLAQKSRAVGIHLILATQKPTVDVITGLIKSNLPARIAFQVASKTDSRVVLDESGADKLLGHGDMLLLSPGSSTLLRGQGTYLSDEEIEAIVATCSANGEPQFVNELVNIKVKEDEKANGEPGKLKNRDEMYEQAVEVVIREGRGSVSLLQRALGIGYGRAARLIDFMADDGIVGAYAGAQAREVVISMADWEKMRGAGTEEEEEPAPKKKSKGPKVTKASAETPRSPLRSAEKKHEGESISLTSKASRRVVLPDDEAEDPDELAPWEEETDDVVAEDDFDSSADAEPEEEDFEAEAEESSNWEAEEESEEIESWDENEEEKTPRPRRRKSG